MVLGEELATYLEKREGRQFLHPELHAELQFGMEQSRGRTYDAFIKHSVYLCVRITNGPRERRDCEDTQRRPTT